MIDIFARNSIKKCFSFLGHIRCPQQNVEVGNPNEIVIQNNKTEIDDSIIIINHVIKGILDGLLIFEMTNFF